MAVRGLQASGLLDELRDVPTSVDPERVKQASRDMSAVLSPGLARLFADRLAQAIASLRGGVVLEVGALTGMVEIGDGRWRSWTGAGRGGAAAGRPRRGRRP